MKFLPILLSLLPAAVMSDYAEAVPEFCSIFSLEITDVSFSFQNPAGGALNQVTYPLGGIRWGNNVGNGKSGLQTEDNVPGTVVPGPEFSIGKLTHINNPIGAGSALTDIELVVTVDVATAGSYSFVYHISIDETPNNAAVCPYLTLPGNGCSDLVFIVDDPSPQTVMFPGGINFEIDLLGFKTCATCDTKTEFISQEGGTTEAMLYANLVLTDCPRTSSNGGDPHFETWTGHQFYDYMGACDLHLVQAPHFAPELPLTIDVRTKIRNWYSYIESAVVQIGEDRLEVSSFGQYSVNGVDNAEMPTTIGGFPATMSQPSKVLHIFEIQIDEKESIILRTFKDMVSVKIENAQKERFHGSAGMMGEFETGSVLARDGITRMEDPIAIANEWQVRDTEPMLFTARNGPQYPQACTMPERTATQAQRRLGGMAINKEAAEEACAHWDAVIRNQCIQDVMSTGDFELAEAGPF